MDLGPHRHQLAVDAHFPGAAQQDAAQRARRLVTDEQHRGVGMDEVIAQMMLDAPGIGHAGSRDDDGAALDIVDRLGVLDRFDDAEARIIEQLVGAEFDVLEHLGVFLVDRSDFAGERTIEEDQARIDFLFLDQPADVVQQFLAALHRKPG